MPGDSRQRESVAPALGQAGQGRSQAHQAAEAVNSTTDEPNEGQQNELASQYLNPPADALEMVSEMEDQTPEESWLRHCEQSVIIEQK